MKGRKYYILFDSKRYDRWWNTFLDSELYHCFLITPSSKGRCVEINFSLGGAKFAHYDEEAADVVDDYIKKGVTSVLIAYEKDIETPRLKFGRTCVGVVKDFLGINNICIITAKQLYNYLVQSGSEK